MVERQLRISALAAHSLNCEEVNSRWVRDHLVNLLPEGEALREPARRYQVSMRNTFALVMRQCREPAGAVGFDLDVNGLLSRMTESLYIPTVAPRRQGSPPATWLLKLNTPGESSKNELIRACAYPASGYSWPQLQCH
jgi:hypothetical protein